MKPGRELDANHLRVSTKVRLFSGELVGYMDGLDVSQGQRAVSFPILHGDLFSCMDIPVETFIDGNGHRERCLQVDTSQLEYLRTRHAFQSI